jgi:hypothetical protein
MLLSLDLAVAEKPHQDYGTDYENNRWSLIFTSGKIQV